MLDSEYPTLVVAAIALAVAAPLAAGATVPAGPDDRSQTPVPEHDDIHFESPGSDISAADARAQSGQGVGVRNLSAETVALRDVTATDVVVRNLTVRQMGQQRNVTLANVSLERVHVRRANLSDVRIRDATIRSRQLLSAFGVPFGGGFNVTNRSVRRVGIRNRTVDGVVVESVTVQSAAGLNLSNPGNVAGDAPVNASSPAITVGNASVETVRSFRVSLAEGPATNGTATTEATQAARAGAATVAESA
ncbi:MULTISPECIES: hypothetical protein [Halorussus]|uniref:hypothetical protein n=1 Tax=Halorussus TaxID=1070314 RepID=UPI000E20EF44|nr:MULTISPECIES: hypothetical protein [Halorussus]NHN58383.1 hypothetical protein [Halorussus sp. JP-T4]